MKKITIEIPKYERNEGFKFNWQYGFEISFENKDGQGIIKANKEGLISLANHLLNMAQDEVPDDYHIHLDDLNSLEEGSNELIIEKYK
jgi:hypothetical protein